MSVNRVNLVAAKMAEKDAQARFKGTLATAKTEFRPANLMGNAVQGAKDKAGAVAVKSGKVATSRPGMIVGATAALGLFLFRKRIANAVRKKISKRRETRNPLQSLEEQPEQSVGGPKPDPTPTSTIREEV